MADRELREPDLGPLRCTAQLLHRPAGLSPAAICRATGGMQAQEPLSGRLSFRSRSPDLTAADINRARTEERSIVRAWVMRKAMHLIDREDVRWMQLLCEPVMVAESRRRLAVYGMAEADQDRALAEIRRRLGEDGPLLRDELSESVERLGIGLTNELKMHMFRLSVTLGIASLGPDRGGRTCLVAERDWLGPRPRRIDRNAALAELARRHLGAFGPATEADMAGWAGLPLRDIRRGLELIADQVEIVRVGREQLLTLRGSPSKPERAAAGVRMLAAYDTYLMGHRNRDFIAGGGRWARIAPGAGRLRATALEGGVAFGVWNVPRSGSKLAVSFEAFEEIGPKQLARLEAEVADIGRFEGMPAELAEVSV